MLIGETGLTLVIKNLRQGTIEIGNAVLKPAQQKSVHFRLTEELKRAIALKNQNVIVIKSEIPQEILDLLKDEDVVVDTPVVVDTDDKIYRDEFVRYQNEASGLNENKFTYAYLPDGSVQTITEKNKSNVVISTTTFTYKTNGDVDTSMLVKNGVTVTTQYIYDANGNLTDTVNTKG